MGHRAFFWLACFALPCSASPGSTAYVLDRHTGTPVTGVTLTIRSEGATWERRTGAHGDAALSEIPPGRYQVHAEKPGFVDVLEFHASPVRYRISPQGGDRWLIPMARAGVITGRVTARDGGAARGMVVVAVQPRGPGSDLSPVRPNLPVRTDDQGRYRLHSLAPGRYLIAAQGDEDTGDAARALPVFYPGERDAARGAVVELEPGGERSAVDITLPAGGAGDVNVTVAGIPPEWEGRRPAVALAAPSGLRRGYPSRIADDSGRARFEGVPEGEYRVLAWGPAGGDLSEPPGGPYVRYAAASAVVRAGETGEVELRLMPGVRLAADLAGPCGEGDSLRLHPNEDWPEPWSFEARRGREGFLLQSLPPAGYRFEIPDLDRSCLLVGISFRGENYRPERVAPLHSAAAVSVETELATGAVHGSVRAEDGPVRGALVSVWSGDGAVPPLVVETDEQGRYVFTGLPAGQYTVAIFDKRLTRSRALALGSGQTRQIDLTPEKDEP